MGSADGGCGAESAVDGGGSIGFLVAMGPMAPMPIMEQFRLAGYGHQRPGIQGRRV